jgi:hypothetical protein
LAPSPTNQPTNKQTNKATKQPTKTPKKTLIGCFTFCPCNFVLAWALPLMAFFAHFNMLLQSSCGSQANDFAHSFFQYFGIWMLLSREAQHTNFPTSQNTTLQIINLN